MSGFKIQGEDLDRRYVTEYELVDYFQNSPTAWAWGSGVLGRLGDGTTTDKSSPVSVLNPSSIQWKTLQVGGTHSLGIDNTGVAWAWGQNSSGQLGTNNAVNTSSPVTVVSGIQWIWISGGSNHSHGISTQGMWYAWGSGTNGVLGDNTTASKSSPVTVAGGGIDWISVSAAATHTIALKNNGLIFGTGFNGNGELGSGNVTNTSSPVSVVGITDWIKLGSKGRDSTHTLAIKSDNTLWAWGQGTSGKLGDNSTVSKSSPVSVVGGFTWKSCSAGSSASAAIRNDGTIWTWGSSNSGQIGDGLGANRSSPVNIAGGGTNWRSVSAGTTKMLAVKTDGTLWGWGNNANGELNDGTTVNKSSPVSALYNINWISVVTNGGTAESRVLGIGV